MKKKNVIITCFTIVVLSIIMISIYFVFINKSGSDMYDTKSDIESVYVISGSTGEAVLLEQKQIEELLEQWNNVRLKRKLYEEPGSGWLYRIQIYQNNSCIDITLSGNKCDVNGAKYSIENNIDELINICNSYCNNDH